MWDNLEQSTPSLGHDAAAVACSAFRSEIFGLPPSRPSRAQSTENNPSSVGQNLPDVQLSLEGQEGQDQPLPVYTQTGTQQHLQGPAPVSAARFARDQLRRAGIDPERVTVPVSVFEPTEWWTTGRDSTHATVVARMINDGQAGLCPGASVAIDQVQMPFQSGRFNVANYRDRDLRDFAADITAECFNQYTNYLETATRAGTRVVTISSGVHNIGAIYQECLEEAVTQIALNPESRPELVRRILGDGAERYFEYRRAENEALAQRVREFRQQNQPTGDIVTAQQREEFERRVLAFTREERGRSATAAASTDEIKQMNGALRQGISDELGIIRSDNASSSPDGVAMIAQRNLETIHSAIRRWENATRAAAENGTIVVIATGNSGSRHYNILARSPHVISVGAADLNNSADNPQLGHVSPFSSTGNQNYRGLAFESPTIVAQGTQVPMQHQINLFGTQRNQASVDGTSVSAPLVGATVGLMLTQNPDLTFSEVRDILRQTAQPLPFAPVIPRAVGMLTPGPALGVAMQDIALLSTAAPTSAQGAGLINIPGAVQAARNRRSR